MATKVQKIAVNTKGDLFDSKIEVYSADRPHLYYMTTLDCDKNMEKYFSQNPKNMPKVVVMWTMTTDQNNHFGYEDQGSLRLHVFLLVLQAVFGAIVSRSYYVQMRETERYFSPHVIMFASLFGQALSLTFKTIHLWFYASNGSGV